MSDSSSNATSGENDDIPLWKKIRLEWKDIGPGMEILYRQVLCNTAKPTVLMASGAFCSAVFPEMEASLSNIPFVVSCVYALSQPTFTSCAGFPKIEEWIEQKLQEAEDMDMFGQFR